MEETKQDREGGEEMENFSGFVCGVSKDNLTLHQFFLIFPQSVRSMPLRQTTTAGHRVSSAPPSCRSPLLFHNWILPPLSCTALAFSQVAKHKLWLPLGSCAWLFCRLKGVRVGPESTNLIPFLEMPFLSTISCYGPSRNLGDQIFTTWLGT